MYYSYVYNVSQQYQFRNYYANISIDILPSVATAMYK